MERIKFLLRYPEGISKKGILKFLEENIHSPKKKFMTKRLEQKVIDFYTINPFRIKGNRGIIRDKEFWYKRVSVTNFFNADKSKTIEISVYTPFRESELKRIAVSNLRTIVLDEDLSLGDKKIIKDIALGILKENLDSAIGGKLEHLSECTRVDISAKARYELDCYGFKLKTETFGLCYNWLSGEIQKIQWVPSK